MAQGGLKIHPHGKPRKDAVLRGDYGNAILALVAHAKRNQWSGVHTDLEGLKSSTDTAAYVHFVTNLSIAMEAVGLTVYVASLYGARQQLLDATQRLISLVVCKNPGPADRACRYWVMSL